VEAGKLALDEDVNTKLRSWKVPENDFTKHEKVNLRRLLSHSAGLNNSGFPGYGADEKLPTLLQVLNGEKPANTAPMRVESVPGTECRYSGGGYVIVQQLLMDVCAKPFPDLMQELALGKLGMRHSTFRQPIPPELADSAAVGHRADGKPLPCKWHVYPEMAAAGLWTTPSDLARAAIALRQSGIGVGKTFLSRETIKEMMTRQSLKGTGLGVGISGEGDSTCFFHFGANEGYRCAMIMNMKSGRGAVIMTNSDSGDKLSGEIIDSIARTYHSPGRDEK
ncbi:MAG: serine hydrolase, partial [Armatimonadetes bacterium]|nr:serine hydrolase [Armatimonadota bacterium]